MLSLPPTVVPSHHSSTHRQHDNCEDHSARSAAAPTCYSESGDRHTADEATLSLSAKERHYRFAS